MQLNTTPVVLAIAVKANQKRMATARIQIGTHYRLLVEPGGKASFFVDSDHNAFLTAGRGQ